MTTRTATLQFSDMKVGQTAQITAFAEGDKAYRQRLIAMGLLPGTRLTITRIAPLGDPVEIAVRGCAISLRKTEANVLQLILVKERGEEGACL